MRKKQNHFLLELIDIVKQELLAVLAVTGVLTFVFNQATASQPIDPEVQLAAAETQVIETANISNTEPTGATLFSDGPTINFGNQIQGINTSTESWSNTDQIANFGYSLQAAEPVEVTITGVSNGNFTLYITASGTISLNGTQFVLGHLKSINRGVVAITNNQLKIVFSAEAKIWQISTLTGNIEVANENRIPAIMSVLPNIRTLRVGAILTPALIVQNTAGLIMQVSETIWSSSDNTVATVNNSGQIKALKPGVVTITATLASNPDITASISISVPTTSKEAPPIVRINTSNPSLEDKVDQLVSDINKETTNETSAELAKEAPVIGMEQSLLEYFTGQTTLAANENIDTIKDQTNIPVFQIIGDFFKKVFSFIGR